MDIKIGQILRLDQHNRVIIIHSDGTYDVVSSSLDDEAYYHIMYFKEYLKYNYLDDKDIQRFKETASQPATLIYLMLKNHNDLIFTDTTRYEEDAKYGIFYLPDYITEEQKDVYDQMKKVYFSHFNELLVNCDYYINEYQLVDCKVYEHVVPPDFAKLEEHLHVKRQK